MRENIKDLKLGEIYDDYVRLKAMDEKYRYCSNSIVFNKAAEGLMTLLKDEITRRKLKELETNHDFKPIQKESKELREPENVTATISTEDITDYKPYTSTYTPGSNNLADMWVYSTTQNNDERLNVNGKNQMYINIIDGDDYFFTYTVKEYEIITKDYTPTISSKLINVTIECCFEEDKPLIEYINQYTEACTGRSQLTHATMHQHIVVFCDTDVLCDFDKCCFLYIDVKDNEVILHFRCDET